MCEAEEEREEEGETGYMDDYKSWVDSDSTTIESGRAAG